MVLKTAYLSTVLYSRLRVAHPDGNFFHPVYFILEVSEGRYAKTFKMFVTVVDIKCITFSRTVLVYLHHNVTAIIHPGLSEHSEP